MVQRKAKRKKVMLQRKGKKEVLIKKVDCVTGNGTKRRWYREKTKQVN